MNPDVLLLGPDDGHVLDRVAEGVFDGTIDSHLTAEFLRDARHHLVVAVDDGTVVAMASAVHHVHPDKAPQLWINEVGVAPTHRRLGLGSRLLQLLLNRATALGCTEAWVLTKRTNTVAQRLYAGAGATLPPEECIMYTFPLAHLEDDADSC